MAFFGLGLPSADSLPLSEFPFASASDVLPFPGMANRAGRLDDGAASAPFLISVRTNGSKSEGFLGASEGASAVGFTEIENRAGFFGFVKDCSSFSAIL